MALVLGDILCYDAFINGRQDNVTLSDSLVSILIQLTKKAWQSKINNA